MLSNSMIFDLLGTLLPMEYLRIEKTSIRQVHSIGIPQPYMEIGHILPDKQNARQQATLDLMHPEALQRLLRIDRIHSSLCR